MSGDPKIDMNVLREMLKLPEPETSEPTEFARSVAATLDQALLQLRGAGIIEVEPDNMQALSAEITDAALESSSLKKLPMRIVKTLIHSELVEEIYGTDDEITRALRPFLDRL